MIDTLMKFWRVCVRLLSARDGRWYPDGAGQMRRWHNGAWQYRSMTPEETAEDWNSSQW
jgi:hypothetical protein